MPEDKRSSFPMLPAKHWWMLRKKFKQSIPGTVTANYLSSALGMEIKSARANVLPYLQVMGIIDEDGKTMDRAKQWRDDTQYADVCQDIIQNIYPSDLTDAVPDPSKDREAASRWFANHTGSGTSAVGRMVSTYALLAEANAEAEPESKQQLSKPLKTKKSVSKKSSVPKDANSTIHEEKQENVRSNSKKIPDININLQIHISSDATPDQIDQIFKSMSQHIYKSE